MQCNLSNDDIPKSGSGKMIRRELIEQEKKNFGIK